jgi:acyl-CoA hydrolase
VGWGEFRQACLYFVAKSNYFRRSSVSINVSKYRQNRGSIDQRHHWNTTAVELHGTGLGVTRIELDPILRKLPLKTYRRAAYVRESRLGNCLKRLVRSRNGRRIEHPKHSGNQKQRRYANRTSTHSGGLI